MNLKVLSRKLKNTRLFSDTQKVELFALFPDASEEDARKLEEGIDAFDAEYGKAIEKQAKQVNAAITELFADMPEDEKAQYQDELDEIGMGLALLQPASN